MKGERHALGGGNNYDYPASSFKELWREGRLVLTGLQGLKYV